ncbi:hypothetical protein LJR230_002125 [Trinickia sp. LjRoot230]|uniref:hypothetical protein n=1 Tax=Trinickia sp. LjRoot230 TaxID=3342288 RepID=UPI003ECC29EA
MGLGVNLLAYLRSDPTTEELLAQFFSPQSQNVQAKAKPSTPPSSPIDGLNAAPGRPNPNQKQSHSSNGSVQGNVSGQMKQWPPELVEGLRVALGPAPDGSLRDPDTFAELPRILCQMSPASIQAAIDIDRWAKQEVLRVPESDPQKSDQLDQQLWETVTNRIRDCAPKQLSVTDIGLLAHSLARAQQPQKFRDIAVQLQAVAVAPPKAQARHVSASPIKATPMPQVMGKPLSKADHLATSITKNVLAAGTFEQVLPLARALEHVDRDTFTNSVVLGLIARKVPAGHGTLQELASISPWAAHELVPHIARTLNLDIRTVETAVRDLRKFIHFNRVPTREQQIGPTRADANALIIDQYLAAANSRAFDRQSVGTALRILPYPEQLIGINMMRPGHTPASAQMHRNAAHPGRPRPDIRVDPKTRKRCSSWIQSQIDSMAALGASMYRRHP